MATNCGGCADAWSAFFECSLAASGCPSCSTKDSVDIPEFMKNLSEGAIGMYQKMTEAKNWQSQRALELMKDLSGGATES